MSSCIADVRRNIGKLVDKLFDEIPGLRIGLVAHGDYCDKDKLITKLDFTNEKD